MEINMPHARIDMHEALRPRMAEMSAAILKGMVEGFDMPEDDLFQIFRLHQPGESVFSRTHQNADRTDMIFLEILASPNYSAAQMQRGLTAVSEQLAKIGIKRDNVILMVTPANAWLAPVEKR
jgi:hypothetical protein